MYKVNKIMDTYASTGIIRDHNNVTKDEIIELRNYIVGIYNSVCKDCPGLVSKYEENGEYFKWYGDSIDVMEALFSDYNEEYGKDWKIKLRKRKTNKLASQPGGISGLKLGKFTNMLEKVDGLILPVPAGIHPLPYLYNGKVLDKHNHRVDVVYDGHTREASYFMESNSRIPTFLYVPDGELTEDVVARERAKISTDPKDPNNGLIKMRDMPLVMYWDNNGRKHVKNSDLEKGPPLWRVKELYRNNPSILDITEPEHFDELKRELEGSQVRK